MVFVGNFLGRPLKSVVSSWLGRGAADTIPGSPTNVGMIGAWGQPVGPDRRKRRLTDDELVVLVGAMLAAEADEDGTGQT